MSIGLRLWLLKRSSCHWTRHNRAQIIRHQLRQQWNDYRPRGKGNRALRRVAWHRVEALDYLRT